MLAQLERVASNIGPIVEDFWHMRMVVGAEFTMRELTSYVERYTATYRIAPDSAGRILRHLRKLGRVNYTLRSRSGSRYQALPLKAAA